MLTAVVASMMLSVVLPQDPDPRLAQDAPVRLEDIVVEGRTLHDATEDFVTRVGAPARYRGLARWSKNVCPGVVNLRPELAQPIIDRISTVAVDLGLDVGDPGCEPNILIYVTQDADGFTEALVESRPRLYRVGGAGMDLGANAMERFQTSGAAVRWWHVSVPVDGQTGAIASRPPGFCRVGCVVGGSDVFAYAPLTYVFQASRLTTQVVDDLLRVSIVVDVDKINAVTLPQLADYLAFVSMAQTEAAADTSRFDTILNVFEDGGSTAGLTKWDTAYLRGLYATERTRKNAASQVREVSASIVQERRDMDQDGDMP